jgi:hypothetical protein
MSKKWFTSVSRIFYYGHTFNILDTEDTENKKMKTHHEIKQWKSVIEK